MAHFTGLRLRRQRLIFTADMDTASYRWIPNGRQAAAEMLAAIQRACHSIRLEMYIFLPCPTAEAVRDALIQACKRGVQASVMIDAWGSGALPSGYWDAFHLAGGRFRRFNPISLNQLVFRDHRKLLVCDEREAFIGGFNVGREYSGDGVSEGWRDLGMAVQGPLAGILARAFDEMFERADSSLPPFARLRKSARQKSIPFPGGTLLLGSPSRDNPFKKALRRDFEAASDIRIMSAYFLPPWLMRRALQRAARRGAKVQIILPAKSDVPLFSLAAQSLYPALLRSGIEVFEYQPQMLHAKLVVADDFVYVGSANLDSRSLNINYELTVRLPNPELAAQARKHFDGDIRLCRRISKADWTGKGSFWRRLKGRLAMFVLAELDPSIARQQWRGVLSRLRR